MAERKNSNSKKTKRKPRKGHVESSIEPGPKAASSFQSAGGGGVTFEHRAQAVKLLHMCLGLPSPGVGDGWLICELRFQARVLGPQTDDLVCTITNSVGETRKVFCQMKSGLSANKSDGAFQDAVGGAWLDYQDANVFAKGKDKIVIVHDADVQHKLRGAEFVTATALFSLTSSEWLAKIETEGVGNPEKRKALESFRSTSAAYAKRKVDDEELFQFLKHLSFLSHNLLLEGTAEEVELVNLIGSHFVGIGFSAEPRAVWSTLVHVCGKLNRVGAGLSFENLASILNDDLARVFKSVRERSTTQWGFQPGQTQISLGLKLTSQSETQFRAARALGERSSLEVDSSARPSSANKLLSKQLDHINARIKLGKYSDAMSDLLAIGSDMDALDEHQKARWYLMRGSCNWHLDHDDKAANDFLKAADLCDDEDMFAAARVRGYFLKKEMAFALQAGERAAERFPNSLRVWLIVQNVRIASGERLTEQEIPSEFRGEADAYQLVSWCMQRDGDIASAAALLRKAMRMESSTFFTRDLALAYTLDSILINGLASAFSMVEPVGRDALKDVLESFEPRLEKLWGLQSSTTLEVTLTNLGFALILLKRETDALALLREARERSIDSPLLIRVEIEAYRSMGEPAKALEFGKDVLSAMPADALVTLAQIAAGEGDHLVLESAASAASNLNPADERAVEAIQTLTWELLIKEGRHQDVLQSIENIDLLSASVLVRVQAAKNLSQAGNKDASQAILSKLYSEITGTTPVEEVYLIAMGLFLNRRFEEAATLLARLIRPGVLTELHEYLLYCYLRLGAYAKAKKLLDSFPDDWMRSEAARHMSIELAQIAGDWSLLKQLSITQLEECPELAMSWIFRIQTAGRESKEELASVLAAIPPFLVGTTQELTQLATSEMANGREVSGLRRIYRMRRKNLTDVDVAAAHVGAHLTARKVLPLLDLALPEIKEGTFFTVVDEAGKETTRVLDPAGFDELPNAGDFRSHEDKEVLPFIGTKVGDVVTLSQPFGQQTVVKVVAIGSSFRRLLESSHALLKESISKSSILTVIELPMDEDGKLDFSLFDAQVKQSADAGKQVMRAYQEAPFTIGGICRLLGRSVYDAVTEWPAAVCKLDVGGASAASREAAQKLLEQNERKFVVDAATLIELARLNCLHLLNHLPNLHCSNKTLQVIQAELEDSMRLPSSGTAVEHNGKVGLVRISEGAWSLRIALLKDIIAAVRSIGTCRPTYGPMEHKRVPKELREVIADEESAVLALCAEVDAILLSLDGRLRLMGNVGGIEGVTPQSFLAFCQASGKISRRDYACAAMKMFLSGRNFTSLGAQDLHMALYQGDEWAQAMLAEFGRHLVEDSVDFGSALKVSLDLLKELAGHSHCEIGYFSGVVSILVEALVRHKDGTTDLQQFLRDQVLAIPNIRDQNSDTRAFIGLVVDEAVARAKKGSGFPAFNGKVLYCSNPPALVSGLSQGEVALLAGAVLATEGSVEGTPESHESTFGADTGF